MAQKKIVDIKRPEKVAPAASSRPILVTNRPVLANDPMMVSTEAEPAAQGEPATHAGKMIKPVTEGLVAPESEVIDAQQQTVKPQPETKSATPQTEPTIESAPESAVADDAPKAEPAASEVDEARSEASAAEDATAAEVARTAREEELEQLITAGTYAVPINAVQRKRSRTYVLLLCLLALVLAVALFDVLLDAGMIKVPFSVPHTHFFGS